MRSAYNACHSVGPSPSFSNCLVMCGAYMHVWRPRPSSRVCKKVWRHTVPSLNFLRLSSLKCIFAAAAYLHRNKSLLHARKLRMHATTLVTIATTCLAHRGVLSGSGKHPHLPVHHFPTMTVAAVLGSQARSYRTIHVFQL